MARLLPIYDAARAMGISPVTLRKRLKAGTARGEQRKTQQGYQWLVSVEDAGAQQAPAPDAAPAAASTESPRGTAPETTRRVVQETTQGVPAAGARGLPGDYPLAGELIARLEAHLADVRAHAGRLEEELAARRRELDEERDAHHRQVQALMALLGREQLASLPAPPPDDADRQPTPTPTGAPPPAPTGEPTPEAAAPPRSGWWRRAWAWLATA